MSELPLDPESSTGVPSRPSSLDDLRRVQSATQLRQAATDVWDAAMGTPKFGPNVQNALPAPSPLMRGRLKVPMINGAKESALRVLPIVMRPGLTPTYPVRADVVDGDYANYALAVVRGNETVVVCTSGNRYLELDGGGEMDIAIVHPVESAAHLEDWLPEGLTPEQTAGWTADDTQTEYLVTCRAAIREHREWIEQAQHVTRTNTAPAQAQQPATRTARHAR